MSIIAVYGDALDKIGFEVCERANRAAEVRLDKVLRTYTHLEAEADLKHRRQRMQIEDSLARIHKLEDRRLKAASKNRLMQSLSEMSLRKHGQKNSFADTADNNEDEDRNTSRANYLPQITGVKIGPGNNGRTLDRLHAGCLYNSMEDRFLSDNLIGDADKEKTQGETYKVKDKSIHDTCEEFKPTEVKDDIVGDARHSDFQISMKSTKKEKLPKLNKKHVIWEKNLDSKIASDSSVEIDKNDMKSINLKTVDSNKYDTEEEYYLPKVIIKKRQP